MDSADREWKERFAALPRRGQADACPRTETLSSWVKGPLPEEGASHLADCSACREDVIAVRRLLAEKAASEAPRLALRKRLLELQPARRLPVLWIAAAAAAVVLIAALAALRFRERRAPCPVKAVVAQPKAKPPDAPAPDLRPEPPREVAKPQPPVIAPPAPVKPPPPPLPEPVKDPPLVAKPPPEPEKPAAPSREACPRAHARPASRIAAGRQRQRRHPARRRPLAAAPRLASRDFMGAVKLKADVAAGKVRVGAHTVYLQRGGELSMTLEEGRTQVQLARGEAFFDVVPGRDPFEVETPQGPVRVKGTRFLVAVDRNETEVVVQRGAVLFNEVALGAGERSNGGAPRRST
jgi:ferric-dicitrate binding protein FerR (iron transport regulator)